jgi:hypothetical protein
MTVEWNGCGPAIAHRGFEQRHPVQQQNFSMSPVFERPASWLWNSMRWPRAAFSISEEAADTTPPQSFHVQVTVGFAGAAGGGAGVAGRRNILRYGHLVPRGGGLGASPRQRKLPDYEL